MLFFVFYVKQFFRSIQWFLFISFLIGQPKSKIVHTDVISESEKMEATFIFDEVIDRDDVSGWIDRNNYFTLSLFNVSFDSKQKLNKEFKYPLISIETADTDKSVQIIFHTAREIESYQLIRHSKGKNVLILLNYLDKEKKLKKEDGELVQSFIVEELPDTFDVMKDRWRHPKTWKDARERSSIRILCDTEGLPIYVDFDCVSFITTAPIGISSLSYPLMASFKAKFIQYSGEKLFIFDLLARQQQHLQFEPLLQQ